MRTVSVRLTVLMSALTVVACGGGTSNTQQTSASNSTAPAAERGAASVNKSDYPVFPNADAGADPAVPADQGGKGFKGEGWQTNTSFDLVGDPRAVKGGMFRDYLLDFPGTLRMNGPESNSALNFLIKSLMYESLLGMDFNGNMDFVPSLATHWQISPDKLTFRF